MPHKIVPILFTDTLCLSSIAIIGAVITIVAYRFERISIESGSNIVIMIMFLFLLFCILIKHKESKQKRKGF